MTTTNFGELCKQLPSTWGRTKPVATVAVVALLLTVTIAALLFPALTSRPHGFFSLPRPTGRPPAWLLTSQNKAQTEPFHRLTNWRDTRQDSRGRLGRSSNAKPARNSKMLRRDGRTDPTTDTVRCRVACPRLKTRPDTQQDSRGRLGRSSNAKIARNSEI